MLIDRIELYLVRNTFSEPWHTAYGTDEENCVLMTRMVSGKHEGWSESSPLPGPHYSYEYGEGIYQLASIPNMVYPHDITPETEGYLDPICEVPLENCAPYRFRPTSAAGTPIKPDMTKMLAKTEKQCIIEAK